MLLPANKTLVFCFTLIIGCTIFSKVTLAQSRWKEGYVITANGDTLHGKIAYKEKSKTPKTIIFKQGKSEPPKRYKPSDLRSFEIHLPFQNVYFKSFSAELDISPTDLASMDNSPAPNFKKCTFFAQLLIAGKVNLYTCTDSAVNKKHFLIETAGGDITDLIYKHYYHDISKTMALYNEGYKKQLEKFYEGCSFVNIKNITETQYTAASLMSLEKVYNKCHQADITNAYEYKREKTSAIFGVDLGAGHTTLKMSGGDYNGIHFNQSNSVSVGIFLNCVLPHTEKKWSIYNELMFTGYKMNSGTYYPNYPYTGITATADLNLSYLKLFTAVRYQFSHNKIKPFLQFGMGNGYAVSVTNNANVHNIGQANPNQTQTFIPFRNYEQSLFGGIGVSYKKFGVEIREEFGNGFSGLNSGDVQSVSTATNYLRFLIKYSFN